MKLLVVGSNGRVGTLVVKEALSRGFDVVGTVKEENRNPEIKVINKDAISLTKEDVKGFDVVVDAVGGWTIETIPNITNAMKHLADILSGTDTKLVVVGGAGSLFVNNEHTVTVDMDPGFPQDWLPLSKAHGEGLKYLRNAANLNWLYVSPACNFVADGVRTGDYTISGEELTLSSKGDSSISYADYALALIDIIQTNKFNKQRISLVSK